MIGCLAEAMTEAIRIDENELEDALWFSREDARHDAERTIPQGLFCPPPLAIATG
jgi:NAD+ diphosphatase